jgi:hypothetical protein
VDADLVRPARADAHFQQREFGKPAEHAIFGPGGAPETGAAARSPRCRSGRRRRHAPPCRPTDETWLGDNGLFRSRKLHVTERLRRAGDTIQYQVTAEGPEVLQKPWTLSRALTLQPDALGEAAPCVDKDAGHYVRLEHHDNTR